MGEGKAAKIRAERCPGDAPCPVLTRARGGPSPLSAPGGPQPPLPSGWCLQCLCQGHGAGSSGPYPRGAGTTAAEPSAPRHDGDPHVPGGHPRVLGMGELCQNPFTRGRPLGRGARCVAAGGTARPCRGARCLGYAPRSRGVYSKSLSGCLRAFLSAITRRQVSAWGRCQLRERGAGDAQRWVSPPQCSRSLWGILLGKPRGGEPIAPSPWGRHGTVPGGQWGGELAGGCRAVTPSCPRGSEPPMGWAGGSGALLGWARSSRGARPR